MDCKTIENLLEVNMLSSSSVLYQRCGLKWTDKYAELAQKRHILIKKASVHQLCSLLK